MSSTASCALLIGSLLVAQPADPPRLELVGPVRKIWDQGPHNAFTDLLRHKGTWYCVFREGAGHAAGAGKIRVITSADGEKWASATLIAQEGVDLRDPHLCVAPDGRLLINGGAAVPPTRDPVKDHYSFITTSKDGKEWSKPVRVLESWQWLWRLTWHDDQVYGVAYEFGPDKPRQYKASLVGGPDATSLKAIAKFDIPQPTEATLRFDGQRLYCLQRRDGSPNTAMLGTSDPPYTSWGWKDLGMYFGGPNFIRTPDGRWLAAGRLMKGKAQTAVCLLDVKAGKLTPLVTLPSGGDTSYPGLAWHDGELWVSYYSGHEGKTSIYLARLRWAKD